MKDTGILIKEFVQKHLRIEEQLQDKITKLETELKNISEADNENEYLLYKSILKTIIPNIQFTYASDGGYIVTLDPPVKMPIEQIDELVNEIKKYKKKLEEETDAVDEYTNAGFK